MQEFSPAKGRKKTVQKFTAIQGLWILGLVTAASVFVLVMFVIGFLRVEGK